MRFAFRSLAVLVLLAAASAEAFPSDATSEILRSRLDEAGGTVRIAGERVAAHPDLFRFYAGRGHAAAWEGQGEALVALIEDSANDGLDPAAYHLAQLRAAFAAGNESPDAATDRDLLLTDAFLRLGEHLLRGRVDPTTLYEKWYPTRRERDLAAVLADALRTGDLGGALDGLRPPHPAYRQLRAALARTRAAAQTDLPIILPASTLTLGDESVRVPLVRRRLALFSVSGAPETPDSLQLVYTADVADAVRRFQQQNGLDTTGDLDPTTRHALNRSPEHWARALALNMERWRWLPDDLGARHVLVNLPAFHLQVVEGDTEVLAMNVVVGLKSWQTPVFSDTMTAVIFNPTWGVPPSIASVETIPLARKNGAEYLSSRGYNVYRGGARVDPSTVDWTQASAGTYYFIQSAGPANPLGEVKFAFPNENDIYIHDTNQKRLFARSSRAFSHGCIRAAEPRELARYVLGQHGWAPEKVDAALDAHATQQVALPAPLPVHLVYFTASADADTGLAFYEDIYDLDSPLAAALGLDPAD